MRRFGTLGLLVGFGFTLPFFVTWSGCTLDTSGFGVPSSPEPGAGGSTSSTTGAGGISGAGGTSGVGGAGGQDVGSGGGQPAGSGGAGGGGGGVDAGCIGGEEICAPWWDTAWTRRRRILVDLANEAALADFPVLVRLEPKDIDYTATTPGGGDVRFVSDDGGVILSHEIEGWASGAKSYVWVRLPMVLPAAPNGPTVIWMYYGNPAAVVPAASEATWDSGFRSVHHFNADTNDSTIAANDGMSPNPPNAGPGIVAGARDFDGADDHLLLPDEGDYDFTTTVSVSTWILVKSFTKNWQAVVAKGDDSWRLHRESNTSGPGFGTTNLFGQNDNFGAPTSVNDGSWHHVAGVYDGKIKKVFVDGTLVSKALDSTIKNSSFPVCIGDNKEAMNRHFHGSIDEVRISSVVRSDAWMIAEHRTVTFNKTVTFGVDQPVP
jgi:hypothetical protein